MRKSKRVLVSLVAMLLMVACLFTTGCQIVSPDSDTTTTGKQPSGNNPGGNSQGGNNQGDMSGGITHTFRVASLGGLPLTGVDVVIYEYDAASGTLGTMQAYGKTDENGVANIKLDPKKSYRAVLPYAPKGYETNSLGYDVSASGTNITLVSRVIEEEMPAGTQYKLGDIIYDFTITDTDGKVHKLSELLKTKKAVMINFWYASCGPCNTEFPYMEAAYQQYKDDIEILALSTSDSFQAVKSFKKNFTADLPEEGISVNGLSFPMVNDELMLSMNFAISAAPTSVMIDRYGMISMIHPGALIATKYFTTIFNHFAAADYKQQLIHNPSTLTPIEKPDVSMPSSDELSAVLNGAGLNVTYHGEPNDEYAWPFVITTKNGEQVIKASNSGKDSSYAMLYANVTMKKNDVLAFDYFASSEEQMDILYVLVNREDIYQISGIGTEWKTCYTFVAPEDGEYELALCYLKDKSGDHGDDTVYLKNLRITTLESIDIPTYIPRDCATGLQDNFGGYSNYVDVFFNEKDGYYHVGSENGPLLLVDMNGPTAFSSEVSILTMAYNNEIIYNGKNYFDDILPFLSLASNSQLYGVCTVTRELGELLKIVALIGWDTVNTENQWLQMCHYYDAYGTNGVQMEDPIKGLANFSAFETVLTTDPDNIQHNYLTYNRILIPRGYRYKFTPETTGAYRITTHGATYQFGLEAWIFGEGDTPLYTYERSERLWEDYHNEYNITMPLYFEAGKTYYIVIAYSAIDLYHTGTFSFDVQYMGASAEIFTLASPGSFTFEETITGNIGATIVGGIKVELGEDGYYHEKRPDGSLGSIVYVDFVGLTTQFHFPLTALLKMGGFNFEMSVTDREVLEDIESVGKYMIEEILRTEMGDKAFEAWAEEYQLEDLLMDIYHGENGQPSEKDQVVIAKFDEIGRANLETYIRENMGDAEFVKWADEVKLDEVLAGKYHGFGDMTERVQWYVENKMYPVENEEAGDADNVPEELEGCIAVDEELGEILQELMDKYSFQVEFSWTKLCYYYKQLTKLGA